LFHKIINDMLTIDEFERAWDYMITLYNLSGNDYLENIYKKREKWAKPFFKNFLKTVSAQECQVLKEARAPTIC